MLSGKSQDTMIRLAFSKQEVMWSIQLEILKPSFQSAEDEQVKGKHSMTKTEPIYLLLRTQNLSNFELFPVEFLFSNYLKFQGTEFLQSHSAIRNVLNDME